MSQTTTDGEQDTQPHYTPWQDRQPDELSDSSQMSHVSDSQVVPMTQVSSVESTEDFLRRMNMAEERLSALGYNMAKDDHFPVPLPETAWNHASRVAGINPLPEGRIPVDDFEATEKRLRKAYEDLYNAALVKQFLPPDAWPPHEHMRVQWQPEWYMTGAEGFTYVNDLSSLIMILSKSIRSYVAFVRQNQPINPDDFRRKTSELAFSILNSYRELARRDILNARRT